MIKKWNNFIREFVENKHDGYIDAKMQELKDLVEGESGGQNFLYEWETKNDHQLLVNFTIGEDGIRYEYDIDDLIVSKIVNDTVEFTKDVDSVEDGLDIIEKDIQSLLGISESYGNWDSSIKSDDLVPIINKIMKLREVMIDDTSDHEVMEDSLEKLLNVYDEPVIRKVIDTIFFDDSSDEDELTQSFIKLGDSIMNKWGTEPNMVINAFEDAFSFLSRKFDLEEEEVQEEFESNRIKKFGNFLILEGKSTDGLAKAVRTYMNNPDTFPKPSIISDMKELGITSRTIFEFASYFSRDSFKVDYIRTGKMASKIKSLSLSPEDIVKKCEKIREFILELDNYYGDKNWYSTF